MRPALNAVGWGRAAGLVLMIALGATAAPGDDPIDLRAATGLGARVAPAVGADGAIAVTFQAGAEWANAIVAPAQPWDWSRAGALVLEIENPGPRPVAFSVRVDDDPAADGRQHCRTAGTTIAPGSTGRYAVNFGPDPMDLGMRGLPGPAGCTTLTANGQGPFDLGHIVGFRLFLHRPAQPEALVVRSARLVPPVDLTGIVDRYGQYAKADWPGKLHEEAEFGKRLAAETSDLEALPALPGRDRFGGWAEGPRLEATGFFRTARVDGRWWLVDPDGRLFFSSGIDCVATQAATIVTGREAMFAWLPEPGDPLSRFFGTVSQVHRGPVERGRTFDFYRANLLRKYGPDFESAARATALRRLPSWGFNTIANWSDTALYRNGAVPYVATAGVRGDHARVSSGSDYWSPMHDPFDPQFAIDVEESLRGVAERVKGDPWCIGYFVDNELSWGGFDANDVRGRIGLGLGALAAATDSPARRALLADLKAAYPDIARLNAAWGTTFAGWAALESRPWTPPQGFAFTDALQRDLRGFVARLARTYFQTIRDTLKRLDPDHLYLGCRFAWKTPEAIAAAAESCDVVGFNIYKKQVDPREWAFLDDLGKPAIIGEFHVGALDRGMFHTGLVGAADQAERAATFGAYVGSVLDNPNLVGCHWFQYQDQPLTGRTHDGENYNIGFVTVTDTPYPEMVAAARAVHRTMYPRRAGATADRAADQPAADR